MVVFSVVCPASLNEFATVGCRLLLECAVSQRYLRAREVVVHSLRQEWSCVPVHALLHYGYSSESHRPFYAEWYDNLCVAQLQDSRQLGMFTSNFGDFPMQTGAAPSEN